MQVRHLEWDSRFFGLSVFAVTIKDSVTEWELALDALSEKYPDLVYIFVQENNSVVNAALTREGAVLYDKKISYQKNIPPSVSGDLPETVIDYTGHLTDELLHLALASGQDSRFKKDPLLNRYFEELYTRWIRHSLDKQLADKVFVYSDTSHSIAGFVSCGIKEQQGNIGLIATAEKEWGKGIGKMLIRAAELYYQNHNVNQSLVVTQQTNTQACCFYEKAGYNVVKKEFVYHWWPKN